MASLKYTVDVDTRGAKASLASLENSIGSLGAAIAGGFAVGNIVAFGDSIIGLQNKLRSLTGDQALVQSMFQDITSIAGAARAPLQETGDLYFRIARAAKDLGISQQETSSITESLAKSMSMTGASAQETSGALLQLGQALQSGRFQGDELRSVLENMPIVSKAMADELGVTIGELRKLGSEGKITSDVFVRAMQKNKKAIDDAFARSVPTAQQALNNLKTAMGIAFSEVATEPGPAKLFIDAAKAVLQLTNDVNALAGTLKTLIGYAVTFGTIWLGFRGPAIVSSAVSTLNGQMKALAYNAVNFKDVMGAAVNSVKNGFTGLGVAFGIFDKSRGSITSTVTQVKGLSGVVVRAAQAMNSLGTMLGGVVRIGLRFAGWVGIFMAVVDVINLMAKAFFGAKKDVISLSGIFKFLIDVVKVVWYLIKELGNAFASYFAPVLNMIGNTISWVAKKFMEFGVIQTVMGWVSALWGQLSGFWSWLKGKAGIKDEAAKPAAAAPPKTGKNDVFGDKSTKISAPTGGGGGKSAKETAKEQAAALAEVKKAILEVTAAYREQAKARLEDLSFQLQSLRMSEDQIQLEQNRRDILKEQSDALKDLAEKTQKLEEQKKNKEISNKGYQEAIALIHQEEAAIKQTTQTQLAASEATIQAIQRETIAIEAKTKAMELSQQANENRAALQALEAQLSLVGLYGDKLDEATAQLELQNKLREIEVEFQNQLLDLENRKTQLSAERYAMELAMLQQGKAQATQAANDQAAAQKKVADATKKAERTDVIGAIRKRNEELKRSIDPVIVALDSYNSVFDNMSNALDNFIETGKFKFSDFARSIILDLAKIAAKAALTKIFTGITTAIFGKAAGGPVQGGKPYLVGEQGPELFVPNSNGSIMTNAALNKNANQGQAMQPIVTNNYITNNINALDSRSVAQVFVENRKSLLGATTLARKELPYG